MSAICRACGTEASGRLTRCGWPMCGACFAEKGAAELDALDVTWEARESLDERATAEQLIRQAAEAWRMMHLDFERGLTMMSRFLAAHAPAIDSRREGELRRIRHSTRWFVLGFDPNPGRRCLNCDRLTTTTGCTEDARHPSNLWHVIEEVA